MTRDGYTATEALAALLIVGLALGGLARGLQVLGDTQAAAARGVGGAVALRLAREDLMALTAHQGPFRSDSSMDFAGDVNAFRFNCGDGVCGARFDGERLEVDAPRGRARASSPPLGQDPGFIYYSATGAHERWPPANPPPPPDVDTLRAIGLSVAGAPVASVRLWVGQRADCEFDVVIRDCRAVTP